MAVADVSRVLLLLTIANALFAVVMSQQIGLISSPPNKPVQLTLFRINADTTVSSENVLSTQAVPLGHSNVQITTNALYLCGLKSGGEVVCESAFGFPTPPDIRFSQVVASSYSVPLFGAQCVCGLERGTGIIYCWGVCNLVGPLPDPDLYRFSKLAMASQFMCGITVPTNATATDIGGPVICWGDQPPFIPEADTERRYSDLACYGYQPQQCCAITTDAAIVCWNGGFVGRQPPTGNRWVSIALTFSNACAMDFSGLITCWLVTQTITNALAVMPGTFSQFTMTEVYSSQSGAATLRVCGIQTNGIVYCTGGTSPSSLQLASLTVGDSAACGLTSTGLPVCFGDPSLPGSPTPPFASYSTPAGALLPFKSVYMGPTHNCGVVLGLTPNTSLVCWNGTSAWTPLGVTGQFSTVAADCGLDQSNTLHCWGAAQPADPPASTYQCSMLAASDWLVCCLGIYPYYFSSYNWEINCYGRGYPQGGHWYQPNAGTTAFNANFTAIYVSGFRLLAQLADNSIYVSNAQFARWELLEPSGPPFDAFAFCSDGFVNHLIDDTRPPNYCYVRGNTTTCSGNLANTGVPCQYAGRIASISCGATTACVLLKDTQTPVCWSSFPAETPFGLNPFAAQMPTQAAVAGLAPQGMYFSTRTGSLQPCPPGTFSIAAGALTKFCSGQCAAGMYSALIPGTNTTTLLCDQPCKIGHYCPQGTPAPIPCPAGTFGSSPGLTTASCTLPCPIGYYCPPGSTSPTAHPCPPGTFGSAPQLGSITGCTLCPVGYFTSSSASVSCPACSAGSYSLFQGSTGCQPCAGLEGVLCQNGHANNMDNYWSYITDNNLVATVSCPPGLCLADGQCAAGRIDFVDNPMCGSCKPGYSSLGNSCIPCTEANTGYIILFLLLSFFWVFIMYHLSQTKGGGDIKIALYFVATSQFMLGPNFAYWLGWMGILNYNPFKAATGVCVLPLDPYTNLALDIIVPLGFLVELIFFGFCHYLFQFVYTYYFREVPTRFGFRTEAYVTAAMSLLIGSYSVIADVCMSYINCVPVRGQLVMWASPSIDCASAYYKLVLIPIAVLLAVLIAGLPFVILPYLWYRNRDGQTPGVIEKAVADFTFRTYHKRFQWWESFAIFRRSALVALSAGLFRYPVQRSQAFCIMNLTALIAHIYCRPFLREVENQMETVSLLLLCVLSILLIGQESNLTTVNAVLATVIVAVPVIYFLLWKTRHETLQRFGPPSQWSLAAIMQSGKNANYAAARRDISRTTAAAVTTADPKALTPLVSDDVTTPSDGIDAKIEISTPLSASVSGMSGGYIPPVPSPLDSVSARPVNPMLTSEGREPGSRAASASGDEKAAPDVQRSINGAASAAAVSVTASAAVSSASSEHTPLLTQSKS